MNAFGGGFTSEIQMVFVAVRRWIGLNGIRYKACQAEASGRMQRRAVVRHPRRERGTMASLRWRLMMCYGRPVR